jgi:hypothetical protein
VNWLEKNPVGSTLLAAGGLLLVTGLGLTLLWRGAPDTDSVSPEGDGAVAMPETAEFEALDPLGAYEIVNNRPVFNTTRRPQIEIEAPEEVEEAALETEEVAEPPRVRLTGVVITPTQRVVTLTPESGGEALVVREGMPLDGEFVGWSVEEVMPRAVSLTSTRGQQLSFELAVHDSEIAKPPEPEPRRPAQDEEPDQVAAADDASDETRSRADEIRERIRERREQLRAEAAQAEAEGAEAQEQRAMSYQEAIQSMIRRNESGNDDENEKENDGDN